MIKKILVANRGEIAMRIFRTCRVMNIATVAIYTRVDRGALHVRYAEEAYCISDSPEDTSYLKPEKILQIAKKTGAAIHPGYGFLSENADFARRCEEEGVIFIGPSADIIARMGIKTTIPFHQRVLKNAAFLKGEYDTTFIDTRFDKEDLKRRQNTDPTVAVIAAALKHYEEEKEAASRATTLPVVGDSLWKYYGKLQMTANNY